MENSLETNVFTPEAIIMFLTAILIDFLGVFCLVLSIALSFLGLTAIGEMISYILDIIGFFIFGSWMILRSLLKGRFAETAEIARETAGEVTRIVQRGKRTLGRGIKIGKRLGLATLGEMVPFLGNIFPCWTLLVLSEIKSQ